LRQIFNADDRDVARGLAGDALERLSKPLPKVAVLLEEAEEDLLAFYSFPLMHWPKLRSTNPLERVNGEIGGVPSRRHLPQRQSAHPSRSQRRDRAKRRVARRSPLSQRPLPGHDPRRSQQRQRQGGSSRAHRSLNSRRATPHPGSVPSSW